MSYSHHGKIFSKTPNGIEKRPEEFEMKLNVYNEKVSQARTDLIFY